MITRVLLSRSNLQPKLVQYDLYNADGWETYGSLPYTIRTDEQTIAEAKSRWPDASIEVHHYTEGDHAYRAPQVAEVETVSEAALGGRCQWGSNHWNNRG